MRNKEEIYPNVFLTLKENRWGCIDNNGRIIIPCMYDSIELCNFAESTQIICGRDGKRYTGHIQKGYYSITEDSVFTGVYDLYSIECRLLIGGFIDFKYNKECQAYLFKFGGKNKLIEGEGTASSPYRFEFPYGEWILLSSRFRLAQNYSYISQDSLPLSSRLWIQSINKSLEGAVLQYHNGFLIRGHKTVISSNILFDEIQIVNSSTILCKRGKARASSYCIVYLKETQYTSPYHFESFFNRETIESSFYEWIRVLDEHYAFVYNTGRIGLLKDGRTAIPCDCSYITTPIDGWCFAAVKYPFTPNKDTWGNYFVLLCNVNIHRLNFWGDDCIIAIDIINEDLLKELFSNGGLKLYKMNEGSNISSFTIADRYKKLFNQTFLHLLNPTSCEETKKHIQYWLSSESVEFQLEIMYEQPGIHETYSIMDALDGDPSAIWNID